jgi:hypothetical protein
MAACKWTGNPGISWASLIQPAIDLCYQGITVNKHADFFGKKVFWSCIT